MRSITTLGPYTGLFQFTSGLLYTISLEWRKATGAALATMSWDSGTTQSISVGRIALSLSLTLALVFTFVLGGGYVVVPSSALFPQATAILGSPFSFTLA